MALSNEAILRSLEASVEAGLKRLAIHHKRWLTQREAKDYINIKDDKTIKRYRDEEGLPYVLVGGTYQYDREALDAWMSRQAEKAA